MHISKFDQQYNIPATIKIDKKACQPSILLIKMVVNTSMVVRFTFKAASKKEGLKKLEN